MYDPILDENLISFLLIVDDLSKFKTNYNIRANIVVHGNIYVYIGGIFIWFSGGRLFNRIYITLQRMDFCVL